MPSHHHRSGGLKQTNKKNKRSKASKRSVNRLAGGRVNAKSNASRNTVAKSKADRRHHQQQKRAANRLALLQKKRGLDGGDAPTPRVVGIISLGESQEIEDSFRRYITRNADKVVAGVNKEHMTAKFDVHKKDGTLTLLTNSSAFGLHYANDNGDDGAVLAALDLCRVCDMVLFVIDGNGPNPQAEHKMIGMSIGGGGDDDAHSASTNKTAVGSQAWDHLISDRGDRILSAIKSQGLPTPITVMAKTAKDEHDEDYMTAKSTKSIRRSATKRKLELKKYATRFATTEFGVGNAKVVEVDLTTLNDDDDDDDEKVDETDIESRAHRAESAMLVRTLCTMAASPPKWVSEVPRAYILAESHSYSADRKELLLTGFIRGKAPFNVNSLLHIPNLGTFACKSVRKATPPMQPKRKGNNGMDVEQGDTAILESDPIQRESLNMFATPDALEGEQNLVGFDEELEDSYLDAEEDKGAPRPAGWSDYQSSWLDAVDDMSVAEGEIDHGELARELNQKPSSASVATGIMDLDEDDDVSPEERTALLAQRRKNKQDELEFPDEIELKEDEKARDRCARYRSLKSFRKSYWDPNENLPESYSSIYHFKSFKATQRDVMADMKDTAAAAAELQGRFWGSSPEKYSEERMDDDSDEDEDLLMDCIPSGSYVTITVEQVSQKEFSQISPNAVISAVSLLPHENKVSVLHMGLCQSPSCEQSSDIPVKSKDVLTFRCGWRTWKGRPVFSQNNLNSDKHKFERYLPQDGAFFAASVFGPVTYAPCPVLVFCEGVSSNREMVALGSILSADANRIVVKRIVLTGYPVRVHKRHATVKYMFYNPDDVRWFKPAGLTTKHGLNGNIVDSVGEHGTMKCLFNAPIKQHDTVCLPLYKRIFPKFANTLPSTDDGVSTKSMLPKDPLVVL